MHFDRFLSFPVTVVAVTSLDVSIVAVDGGAAFDGAGAGCGGQGGALLIIVLFLGNISLIKLYFEFWVIWVKTVPSDHGAQESSPKTFLRML